MIAGKGTPKKKMIVFTDRSGSRAKEENIYHVLFM